MQKNDFLFVLADAIQTHEGWGTYNEATGTWTPTRSVINNNEGNIKNVGQALFKSADANNFGVCANPIDGKQIQLNDLGAKIDGGLNTIADIITRYAPPTENNTAAYIAAVVAFFNARNIPITATTPIDNFIATFSKKVVLIVANNHLGMADWAILNAAIVEVAKWMPDYAFSVRYNDADLTPLIVTTESAMPVLQEVQMISVAGVRQILTLYNEGQPMNALIYPATIMNGQPNPCGGCEYVNATIVQTPASSIASVADRGQSDILARDILHELIHCLFTLTGLPDDLHQILIAGQGYAANAITDLLPVYETINGKYKTGNVVVAAAKEAVTIASTDTVPADRPYLIQLLQAVWTAMKNWSN